jgi:hypothetical protein
MTTKKTAVDYLLREISEILGEVSTHGLQNLLLVDAYKKAKSMEKEQIIDAFNESRLTNPMLGFKHVTFEEYYNETYEQ